MSDSLAKLLSQSKELVDIQTEELTGLTVAPARELRDYHQQLWVRFGQEEATTIKRMAGVHDRLSHLKEALRELRMDPTTPSDPMKVERVRFLTREVQA